MRTASATIVQSQKMGVTPSRLVVAEILQDLRSGVLLDASFERRATVLDERDRRWAQELTYGLLRKRSWLDSLLTERVRGGLVRLDPDLCDLLRAGAYQLLQMRSVPPYAAIAQTVELAKTRHGLGASKLVNAVLRRLDRERDSLGRANPTDPVEALVLTHSHPRWLVQRWIAKFGIVDTTALLASNNTEPTIYVRPFHVVREQLEASLEAAGLQVGEAPMVRDSIKLPPGVALTELAAYAEGRFFVQDPAATLVTQYAALPPGSVVADVCAAPGGKSLEMARGASLVVASDKSATRLSRLAENIRRIDTNVIELLVMDARNPAIGKMDAVLVDAPCSGTGTFRRHPDARWRLKAGDIPQLNATQKALLDAAAEIVKPGGLLVYSTCSLEFEENDQQIDQFLASHPEFTLEPPPPGTVPMEALDRGLLRVLPQLHGTDGAFAARLRKA